MSVEQVLFAPENWTDKPYTATHPWLRFTVNLAECNHLLWMRLGEARSKCEHLAGVPLRPEVASELWRIYLAKGAHATTSIEGNTLSEEDVRRRMEGELPLPPSQEYLGVEVDNVVTAIDRIDAMILVGDIPRLNPAWIKQLNAMVLAGLDVDDDTVPGEFRHHNVGVALYRAPDWPYVEELMDRLSAWLDELLLEASQQDAEMRFSIIVLAAILSHLYLAWIHPFGDGNGRTARLIEFQLLASSGFVPLPAANLLSDHYNRTRSQYYRELDRASKSGGDVQPFLNYALQGFVDGLREQLAVVRRSQLEVAWENFVHTTLDGPETPTTKRRKHLVLDMPDEVIPRSELTKVSSRVVRDYATTGPRTLSRDLNALVERKLIRRRRGGYQANRQLISAFLPPLAELVDNDLDGS